jgi:NADPH-dependent 2,4-dienoyl-CoA reductase/sulfur reductase-like enzyme
MRRYVIIGSGAAGISAVEAIRQSDASGEIVLVSDDPHGYYSRPGLAYYLTGELPEDALFPFTEKDFTGLHLRRIRGQVSLVDPQAHTIQITDGPCLAYDRLLLATGAQATRPSLPGIDLEGVVKLDHLEDARRILRLAHRAKSAVVVGGGITALEIVEGLRARGKRTHYFLRGDRYWSNVLDEHESRVVEHRLREEGVQVHYQTELAEILGSKGRVTAVRTEDGRLIQTDLLAVAIGIQPRKALAAASGIKTDRGVVVNETLQTNHPDIFAAGDAAQIIDPISGKAVMDSLWGPARRQGTTAGLNMAGANISYRKPAPFNVTRLSGLTTTIIGSVGKGSDGDLLGIARGDSETFRQLPDAIVAQADFDINCLRVLVGEQHLLGAIVMGDQTLSQPLQRLVIEKADITPIREQLIQGSVDLADMLVDYWIRWRNKNAQNLS